MSDEHPRTDSADERMAEVRRAIPAAPSDVAGPWIQMLYELRHPDRERVGWQDNADLMRAAAAEVERQAALIQSLSHDREVMREALEDVVSAVAYTEVDCGRRSYGLKTSFGAAFQKARAALASVKGGAE